MSRTLNKKRWWYCWDNKEEAFNDKGCILYGTSNQTETIRTSYDNVQEVTEPTLLFQLESFCPFFNLNK